MEWLCGLWLPFKLTICFNRKMSCFWNITGYLKYSWTKHWLVCIPFAAFSMLIPNMGTIFNNFEIFDQFLDKINYLHSTTVLRELSVNNYLSMKCLLWQIMSSKTIHLHVNSHNEDHPLTIWYELMNSVITWSVLVRLLSHKILCLIN